MVERSVWYALDLPKESCWFPQAQITCSPWEPSNSASLGLGSRLFLQRNVKVEQLLAVAVSDSRKQDMGSDQWLLHAAHVKE